MQPVQLGEMGVQIRIGEPAMGYRGPFSMLQDLFRSLLVRSSPHVLRLRSSTQSQVCPLPSF